MNLGQVVHIGFRLMLELSLDTTLPVHLGRLSQGSVGQTGNLLNKIKRYLVD